MHLCNIQMSSCMWSNTKTIEFKRAVIMIVYALTVAEPEIYACAIDRCRSSLSTLASLSYI